MIVTEEQYKDKVIDDAVKSLLLEIPITYESFIIIKKYFNYVYTIGMNSSKRKGNIAINKRIEQIKNGKVIDEFKSISDASRKIGISIESISKVLRNRGNTAGGYFWRYKNTP